MSGGKKRRAAAVRRRHELAIARDEAFTVNAAEASDTLRWLTECVTALPEPYRGTLLLRYLRELTPNEIAAATGEPVRTVKTRLQRGLALLRERFDVDGRDWRTSLCFAFGLREVGGGAVGTGAAAITTGILWMSATKKLAFAAVALLVAALGLWQLPLSAGDPAVRPAERADSAAAAAPSGFVPMDSRLFAPNTSLTSLRMAVPPAAGAAARDFDAVYGDIVATMLALRHSAQVLNGTAQPLALPDNLGELFREMTTSVTDCGPRTLQKIAAMAPVLLAAENAVHNRACRLILEIRLQVIGAAPDLDNHRRELVRSMLDLMLVHEDVARLIYQQLHCRKQLDATHEPQLRAMLQMAAGELGHLRPMVLDLLLDLWIEVPDRSSDLMRLLDGSEGPDAKRGALARLLLVPRYRELALDRIVSSHDILAMDEGALMAARTLDADEAIRILRTLKSCREVELHPLAGYTVLAERFPMELLASYQDSLGRGLHTAHRENAVQALAFQGGDVGSSAAELAFTHDTELRCRGIGLLALARLPTNDFARHFDLALADASFTMGQYGPVYLANALRNHAPRCTDVNFLDRATSTLLAMLPIDMAQARSNVEALRRQHVSR